MDNSDRIRNRRRHFHRAQVNFFPTFSEFQRFSRNEEQIIEGAAGVALASMIKKAPEIKGKFVVSILCGGNIDEKTHSKILFDRKKVRKTRIVRSLEEPELIT